MKSFSLSIQDKFTKNFKQAIKNASEVALYLNQPKIESDYLLIGIVLVGNSLGAEVLKKMRIDKYLIERLLRIHLNSIKNFTAINQNRINSLNFSESSVKCIEMSAIIAMEHKHKYIGTEHLLASLFKQKNNLLLNCLKVNNIKEETLKLHIENVLKSTSKFKDITEDFISGKKKEEKKTPALDYFAIDLTSKQVISKLDPVIGREKEIERVISVLCRRTKNNPVLVGDPGVGKTAIVEGLAQKISKGNVPEFLKNKRILALDLSLTVAGTIYRGEFENRLKQIIEEAKQNKNIILFIDEIHNLVGTGASSGALDAANILKPALARGEVACIGATTLEEYKKYIESDAALERRFHPIIVTEPSISETIQILKGIKDNYEKYHQVKITDSAIQEAVNLADRFIPERFFPDKAIDIIDEAASKKKIEISSKKKKTIIEKLKIELMQIIREKEKLVLCGNFNLAEKLKKKEEEIISKIKDLEKKKGKSKVPQITKEDVREVVSRIVKIPFLTKKGVDLEKLVDLEDRINSKIIGQKDVIKEIVNTIKKAHIGLSDPKKPLASFIFLGPSGVGKTETAKVLAKELFGSEKALIRIDMSEYQEAFTVSKLIGAPAGYVGYKEETKFTDQVRKRPYSVILLDEMEKAHQDVFNIFLQILEDGFLTDAVGRHINFKNTILIFTSNIGLESFNKQAALGFNPELKNKNELKIKFNELKDKILKSLREQFRIEFLNRIDKILIFNPLNKNDLKKIVELRLKEVNERLNNKNFKIELSKQAIEFLAEKSFNPDKGARAVRSIIQDKVEDLLAELFIKGKIKPGDKLKIDAKEDKLVPVNI